MGNPLIEQQTLALSPEPWVYTQAKACVAVNLIIQRIIKFHLEHTRKLSEQEIRRQSWFLDL